ncbi:MAG: hypothetical protein U1E53_19455 [Dongiaceae bacterium]
MVARVRRMIAGLLVLAMLALSALPAAGPATAAPAPCQAGTACALDPLPCADHRHGATVPGCCHGNLCPGPVLGLAPATPPALRPPSGAAFGIPESPRLPGIATRPGLHPPEPTA